MKHACMKPARMRRTIAVKIGGGTARVERFDVEYGERTTLLDALETIRTGAEPDLAYRHSCHHGSCGTCAVRVDGKEVLACMTPLASLEGAAPLVEPLAAFELIADLAVDPGRLFRSQPEDATQVRAAEVREDTKEEPPETGRRVRFEDCIECGSCVSACPVAASGDAPFVGPAALAAADRERSNRPERSFEMLAFAARPDGVAACERHFDCSRVCPRAVYPGKHIEVLRREIGKPSR